jgi:hypothetical protein
MNGLNLPNIKACNKATSHHSSLTRMKKNSHLHYATGKASQIFHEPVTLSREGGVTFTVSASSTRLGSPSVASLENALPLLSKTDAELVTSPHTRELAIWVKRGTRAHKSEVAVKIHASKWRSNRLVLSIIKKSPWSIPPEPRESQPRQEGAGNRSLT